jgi:hypothetical protein
MRLRIVYAVAVVLMSASVVVGVASQGDATSISGGTCGGEIATMKFSGPTKGVGLTDETQQVKAIGTLVRAAGGLALSSGNCSNLVARSGDPHVPAPPASLTPIAEHVSLLGNASCARGNGDPNTAISWPLSGKLIWTMQQTYTDLVTHIVKHYTVEAYVTISFGTNTSSDVVTVNGTVIAGLDYGASVTGSWFVDPAVKVGTGRPNWNGSGYVADGTMTTQCVDSIPGNADVLTAIWGSQNTGPAGNAATSAGLTFSWQT